jgi:hypothetical protein
MTRGKNGNLRIQDRVDNANSVGDAPNGKVEAGIYTHSICHLQSLRHDKCFGLDEHDA